MGGLTPIGPIGPTGIIPIIGGLIPIIGGMGPCGPIIIGGIGPPGPIAEINKISFELNQN